MKQLLSAENVPLPSNVFPVIVNDVTDAVKFSVTGIALGPSGVLPPTLKTGSVDASMGDGDKWVISYAAAAQDCDRLKFRTITLMLPLGAPAATAEKIIMSSVLESTG